ncbi:hypothetical protein UFOVP233_6 [uncultured Caudovirales phage]|uniref:Uncharacterized protein n=1 Tax=uncultured Caudovirales phage TaxID=2100421 RepID=A0A6J7WYV4_9CAUD|nr:hypothetical protein UFOVP233_6 [uncultured Caudovirales phage]
MRDLLMAVMLCLACWVFFYPKEAGARWQEVKTAFTGDLCVDPD